MRNFIVIFFCLFLLFSSGCGKNESVNSMSNPNRDTSLDSTLDAFNSKNTSFFQEDESIQVLKPNIFEMNFIQLREILCNNIEATEFEISMPYMYHIPSIDICFSPSGEVFQFNMSLWKLDSVLGGDYVMSSYLVTGKAQVSDMVTELDISQVSENFHFAKEYCNFNFMDLYNFSTWISDLNFQDILLSYIPKEPVGYRFMAGPIRKCIMEHPDTNYTILDCTNEHYLIFSENDFSNIDADSVDFLIPGHSNYYVILSYYVRDEQQGCPVPIKKQSEEMEDYALPVSGAYNINNILILLPPTISNN